MSASSSSPLSGCQLPLQNPSGAGGQLRRHQRPGCHGLPPLLCCVPGEWVTSTSRIPHTPFQPGRATRLPQVTTPVSPLGLPSLCGGARQPDARTPRSLCPAAAVPASQLDELAALAVSSQLSTAHKPWLVPAVLSHEREHRSGPAAVPSLSLAILCWNLWSFLQAAALLPARLSPQEHTSGVAQCLFAGSSLSHVSIWERGLAW